MTVGRKRLALSKPSGTAIASGVARKEGGLKTASFWKRPSANQTRNRWTHRRLQALDAVRAR